MYTSSTAYIQNVAVWKILCILQGIWRSASRKFKRKILNIIEMHGQIFHVKVLESTRECSSAAMETA